MGAGSSQYQIHQPPLLKQKNTVLELYLFSASAKDPKEKSQASVFEYHTRKDSVEWVKSSVHRLRLIRHPGIIKFISVQEESSDVVRIVTEPVLPLRMLLNTLSQEHVILGIRQIIETLEFLHSEKLCHNNLRLDSIYISSEDGRWLVGGLEAMTPFNDLNPVVLAKLRMLVPADIVPPEDLDPTLQGEPAARDSYALGFLLSDIISRFLVSTKPMYPPTPENAAPPSEATTKTDVSPTKTDSPPPSNVYDWYGLQDCADKMLSRQPVKRLRASECLRHPFFSHNPFANAIAALGGIRTLDASKKTQMFAELPAKLSMLSSQTVVEYILPLLLQPEMFSEPGSSATFAVLFSCRNPQPILTPSEYQTHILPYIKANWTIRRLDVRRGLLETFEEYLHALVETEHKFIETVLLSEILIGLEEIDMDVYIMSIKCLCILVPRIALTDLPSSTRANITDPLRPSAEMLRPSPLEVSASSVDPTRPDSATQSRAGDSSSQQLPASMSIQSIVDGFVIPHILTVVCMEDVDDGVWWQVVESCVMLWKRLCVLEGRYKMAQLRIPTRSLLRLISLILKSSSSTRKVFIVSKLILSDLTPQGMNAQSFAFLHWGPRAIELLTPMLRDESKDLRTMAASSIQKLATAVSEAMDHAPSVLRRRDESESTTQRLRRVTHQHSASRRIRLPRMGPRVAAPQKEETAGPIKLSIDRSSLDAEDDWVDEPTSAGGESSTTGMESLNSSSSSSKTKSTTPALSATSSSTTKSSKLTPIEESRGSHEELSSSSAATRSSKSEKEASQSTSGNQQQQQNSKSKPQQINTNNSTDSKSSYKPSPLRMAQSAAVSDDALSSSASSLESLSYDHNTRDVKLNSP
ncbi:hypothetical protein SmJEL517_g01800 [Synchytrium microbalum]|uniref:Protein kinase domain-containing protein n=1 Tax=Synchytrium microbalum TaxID=1806994 RepID=A0A507C9P5_9FUNG|nr:uncharacterized protein SmJEL517_g01800 [Synchytrium microbalum]TPX35889.1 hypothetical protein SmJEL517_g01800 [Synchytrium microbalum]